jgi:hypothetical protein
MMLRSAASPGSWGRSTGRQAKNGSSCRHCKLVDPQFEAPLPYKAAALSHFRPCRHRALSRSDHSALFLTSKSLKPRLRIISAAKRVHCICNVMRYLSAMRIGIPYAESESLVRQGHAKLPVPDGGPRGLGHPRQSYRDCCWDDGCAQSLREAFMPVEPREAAPNRGQKKRRMAMSACAHL